MDAVLWLTSAQFHGRPSFPVTHGKAAHFICWELLMHTYSSTGEEALLVLSVGMNQKGESRQFSLDLQKNLLKIDVWKSRKHGRECRYFVSGIVSLTSWPRPACLAQVSVTTLANFYVHFSGKEGAKMAVALGIQVGSQKVVLLDKYFEGEIRILHMEIFAYFVHFGASLCLRFGFPLRMQHNDAHRCPSQYNLFNE